MKNGIITPEDITRIEQLLLDDYILEVPWDGKLQKDGVNLLFYTSGIHAMTKAVIAYLKGSDKEARA